VHSRISLFVSSTQMTYPCLTKETAPSRVLYSRIMRLDLSSWKKALNSLERAIARSTASPADEELRDAVIQRFEYCYELSWKMLKAIWSKWCRHLNPWTSCHSMG
jgi:hypothetical protein